MNKRYLSIVLLLLIASCNNKDGSKIAHRDEATSKPTPSESLKTQPPLNSFETTYQRFLKDFKNSDTLDLKAMMTTDINCCGEGSDYCIQKYFRITPPENGVLFRKEILRIAENGYSLRNQLRDSISVIPKYLLLGAEDTSFLKNPPTSFCHLGNCNYIPGDKVQIFSQPDTNSSAEISNGKTYVQFKESKNCNESDLVDLLQYKCQWDKILTQSGKSGWIKSENAESLSDVHIQFKKIGTEWKLSQFVINSCAIASDYEGDNQD